MLQVEDRPPVGSLSRSIVLLRCLASAGLGGVALTELSRDARLPHATAHRLLRQLQDEGMVSRTSTTRRYTLGPVAFELGLAAAIHHDLRGTCADLLVGLVANLRGTAYLCARSGTEAVCIDRVDGSRGGQRVQPLQPGSRRPLGAGAAGLALLAAMPDEERCQVLAAVERSLRSDWGVAGPDLLERLRRAGQTGIAVTADGVTRGITAVAVAFRDGSACPVGAISVAVPTPLMTDRRRVAVRSQLLDIRALVETRLAQRRLGRPACTIDHNERTMP